MLTSEEISMIRESTIDDAAFQRMVSLIEAKRSARSDHAFLFNLSEEQVGLISAVLDAIPLSIYIKDTQSRFIMINQKTMDVMRVSNRKQIIGKSDLELIDNEIAQQYYKDEQELMKTGQSNYDQEFFLPEKFGGPNWYLYSKSPVRDSDGTIVGLIGVNIDITRQKLAEKSVETERNLLKTVIDHIQDKIYVKDRESRFVMTNAATLQEHHTSADKMVGTSDFDYMIAERAQQMKQEEQIIMKSGMPIINQELYTPEYASPTLEHDKWFLVSKVPIYDEEEIVGLVGINRDITDRKIAEQHAAKIKLEQERSHILAEFITHSSHEFRTPLSVIQTSIYLLQKTDDPVKHQQYINSITRQTTIMNNLVDDLQLMLRLDKPTHFQRYSVYLDSILKTVFAKTKAQLEAKTLTLNVIEGNAEVIVSAERELLGIALCAIIDNAIRYTPDSGTITVHYAMDNNQIVISVSDTGIGMLEETVQRVFERFYRADEAHSTMGFGLGLSIAKRVIELHDGDIMIDSQIGVGSTIKILLPV